MARSGTTEDLLAHSRVGVWRSLRLGGWAGRVSLLFYLTAFVTVASLLLGGGTRGGFLSDALLQWAATPLLLVSLWKLFDAPLTNQIRVALAFCLALALLPLIQLIPLPPWLWTMLPSREPSATAFELVGQAVPWMPISVSPQATWLAALSLVPPLAIFLGCLMLSYRERRWLSLVILAIGILSVFVGLIQVAQGPGSSLRFFRITNPSEAVGFFANRNHFAALIYALMLFAVAWTVHASAEVGTGNDHNRYDVASILTAIGGFTALVVFFAGEAMARSRAGLGLTIVALLGALVLGLAPQLTSSGSASGGLISRFKPDRARSGITPARVLVAAIALTVTFSLQFALFRIQERFTSDLTEDARRTFAPVTIEAAKAYMPLGSGLGTFVSVYPLFEKTQDALPNTFANHAHNDVVEVWLETGILGLVLMGLFVSWLVLRSVAVWRSAPPIGAAQLDWSLARAATMAIPLILAHSLVDYPLRTSAMMAIMAFACALLIEPTGVAGQEEPGVQVTLEPTRRREKRESTPAPAPALVSSKPKPRRLAESPAVTPSPQNKRWGADINWPKEWSTPSPSGTPLEKDGPESGSTGDKDGPESGTPGEKDGPESGSTGDKDGPESGTPGEKDGPPTKPSDK